MITKIEKTKKSPWLPIRCVHPSHEFPSMLVIPVGETVTHTCPACGQKTTCSGPDYNL